MKKYQRFLCISISLAMILGINTGAYATSFPMTDTCSLHEDGVYIVDPENVIDALSLEDLENQNCVERVSDLEEDLHSVVYECADGNYVEYIFQYPVKYVDSNGFVKDISTSIKSASGSEYVAANGNVQDNAATQLRNEYAFSSEENSIKVFYSDDLSNTSSAIVATNSDWTIGLAPSVSSSNAVSTTLHSANNSRVSASAANDDDTFSKIEYSGAFNGDVSLYYRTTYTGYKELIEIKSPIENNTFQFVLTTNGLLPEVSETGEILLHDPATNQVVASFAQLFVYDSSEIPLYTLENAYKIQPIKESEGLYLVTIVIDNEFLAGNDTTYPVIVDPSFSFNTSSAINDAPVYSGLPSSAQGSNYYNHIGYVDNTYGVGSLLVKFPALKSNTLFNGLSDSRINSVTFNVEKIGGSNSYSSTLRAYRYTGSSWSESTVTYNSAAVDSYTGSLVSSVSMTSNTWYSFDITSVAKAWKNGTASYDSGLVIKNATNTTNNLYERVLASVEYGKSINNSSMPYVTIVFNNSGVSAGFTTANLAAKNFAECVYSSSQYSRIEYAATIYSLNGKYYYYNVHNGNPHDVSVSSSVPSGATYVAYIHTHPNSNSFSDADISAATTLRGDAYVVTPSLSVKKYTYSTGSTTTPYSNLTIYPLSDSEKSSLVSSLRSVWNGHFKNGVCPKNFGCENKTWPNE